MARTSATLDSPRHAWMAPVPAVPVAPNTMPTCPSPVSARVMVLVSTRTRATSASRSPACRTNARVASLGDAYAHTAVADEKTSGAPLTDRCTALVDPIKPRFRSHRRAEHLREAMADES